MSFSLETRIQILQAIGDYITSDDMEWAAYKRRAENENPWFTQKMIDTMTQHIQTAYTDPAILRQVVSRYALSDAGPSTQLGIINAGNIPLVGFHDFMAAILVGLPTQIKLSSKDKALFEGVFDFVKRHFPDYGGRIGAVDKLENCDAYIATGGETSSLYFEKYFGQKPNIIRGHRSSIAILDGQESAEQLSGLADDIHLYFGLGCRSVTQVYVPEGFDFGPLLESYASYADFQEHTKYMNNYDYQLAIYIINGDPYMTRYSTIMVENPALSSAVSVVHYSYYTDADKLRHELDMEKIQCIVSAQDVPFGRSQYPGVMDFADGVDLFEFLREL